MLKKINVIQFRAKIDFKNAHPFVCAVKKLSNLQRHKRIHINAADLFLPLLPRNPDDSIKEIYKRLTRATRTKWMIEHKATTIINVIFSWSIFKEIDQSAWNPHNIITGLNTKFRDIGLILKGITMLVDALLLLLLLPVAECVY
uniref:Uncharacterized protein n=1 Tax=Glossina brevipalpis TaxID=37001 RepID=A0A1A9W1D2_9MUSC